MAIDAHHINSSYMLGKSKVIEFMDVVRRSRKYGFPVINVIRDKNEVEQIEWAARLLLSISCPDILEINCSDDEFKKELTCVKKKLI